jgi:dephospho-CoA kinase
LRNSTKTRKPIIIGLTGGPGVGKTEVAKIFARHGAQIIYGDKIGHDVIEKNKTVKRQLANLFGKEIFDAKCQPDRSKIGKLVFAAQDNLAAFNSIVHPPLLKMLKQEIKQKAKKRGAKIIVVDAALIYEWGIANWFDWLLVVDSSRANRIKRMAQNGLGRTQISQRIRSQMPQKDKIALADFVINNNGHLPELWDKVFLLLNSLQERIIFQTGRHIRHKK